jgi:hypothetical protein
MVLNFKDRLQVVTGSITLGRKDSTGSNTLAYLWCASVRKKKKSNDFPSQ